MKAAVAESVKRLMCRLSCGRRERFDVFVPHERRALREQTLRSTFGHNLRAMRTVHQDTHPPALKIQRQLRDFDVLRDGRMIMRQNGGIQWAAHARLERAVHTRRS